MVSETGKRFCPETELFSGAIASEQWGQYCQLLDQTLRWQGGLPLQNPEFRESVLDHTRALIRLSQKAFSQHPVLHQTFRQPIVENILWTHDGGEIAGEEIPASATPKRPAQIQACREWLGVMTTVFPLLQPANGHSESSLLQTFLELHQAFETQSPDSPWHLEAALALLLDTIQGNQTAHRELFADHDCEAAQRSAEKVGLPRVFRPTEILAKRLTHEPTRQALAKFVNTELNTLYEQHYAAVYARTLARFPAAQALLTVVR